MNRARPAIAGLFVLLTAASAHAQTLKGSHATMSRQFTIAKQHDFTFLRTASDVNRFIRLGLLLKVSGNADYALARVSHPYARPAVRTFVERLAAQYRGACGEKLVVTSLTRPLSKQPRNASDLSVHPAGMAVDLRRSRKAACRRWLENTLLALERRSVLDATRERFPAHYHVAIYPEQYLAYVDRLTGSATRLASAEPAPSVSGPSVSVEEAVAYRVSRGETLWSIARRHGITVDALKDLNGLSGNSIKAGQVLSVPGSAQQ